MGRPKRKAARKTPGPKPSITLQVVKRVANRYALGVPLREALAAEANPKINEETWKKALAAHPEFSPHYEAARGKFLEDAMRRLAQAEDLKYLKWLLERRYPGMFAEPGPAVAVNVSTHISGLPDDVLARARALASAECGVRSAESGKEAKNG